MGGGHQLSEAGAGQNAKNRNEIWHTCYWLVENAVSIDELAQRKTCFLAHRGGSGVTANDNVTCMLQKEPPCTLDALHVLFRQNSECLQPKTNLAQYPTCFDTSKISFQRCKKIHHLGFITFLADLYTIRFD